MDDLVCFAARHALLSVMQLRFASLALLPAVLLFASRARAAEHYLDSSGGNDVAAGTSSGAPWKTIKPLLATKLAPGDTVRFKAGGNL